MIEDETAKLILWFGKGFWCGGGAREGGMTGLQVLVVMGGTSVAPSFLNPRPIFTNVISFP